MEELTRRQQWLLQNRPKVELAKMIRERQDLKDSQNLPSWVSISELAHKVMDGRTDPDSLSFQVATVAGLDAEYMQNGSLRDRHTLEYSFCHELVVEFLNYFVISMTDRLYKLEVINRTIGEENVMFCRIPS